MDVFGNLYEILNKDLAHQIGAVFVIALSLAFAWHVVWRGVQQWLRLRRLGRRIASASALPFQERVESLRVAFTEAELEKPWQEFRETLHEKRGAGGQVEIRATAPAEAFFNPETLVDGPLHAEFYKHLPGILTGIGIIATFSGLIFGLAEFNRAPTDAALDPVAVSAQRLSGLFTAVQGAFLVSAAAIGLAMLFTMIEKVIYASCVTKANLVSQELDHLFQSGVGEEYLATLTQSAQESASQARQLKEAIVGDLKEILTNLTNEQIRAYQEVAASQVEATRQMSASLGASIQDGLKGPLQQIADTVRTSTEGQAKHSGEILERLMSTFIARMKDTVGDQMGGLAKLIETSSQTMARVEASLGGLAEVMRANTDEASQRAAETLATISTTLSQFQENQQRVSEEMNRGVQERLAEVIERFSKAQEEALKATQDASRDGASRIASAGERVVEASVRAQEESRKSIDHVLASSTEIVEQINQTLRAISDATSGVASASDRLSGISGALEQLHARARSGLEEQTQASTQLSQASQSLSTIGSTIASASQRLELVAGRMASEAEVRAAMLTSIRDALSDSERVAKEFNTLTKAIEQHQSESFQRFGKGVVEVLDKNLSQFDGALAEAARMFAASIGELSSKAEDIEDAAEQVLKATRRT